MPAAEVGPSIGQLCPDELAVYNQVRDAGQYISPSRLHSLYERYRQAADVDWDFGTAVLTFLNRRGESRPVDLAVGERVTRQLQRSRA